MIELSAAEIARILGVDKWHLTGSSYVCNPPVLDTDYDVVMLAKNKKGRALRKAMDNLGFCMEGSSSKYGPGSKYSPSSGKFNSWRKGRMNIILTQDKSFYQAFVGATLVAKRLNLLSKEDRITLFEAILYGEYPCKP